MSEFFKVFHGKEGDGSQSLLWGSVAAHLSLSRGGRKHGYGQYMSEYGWHKGKQLEEGIS